MPLTPEQVDKLHELTDRATQTGLALGMAKWEQDRANAALEEFMKSLTEAPVVPVKRAYNRKAKAQPSLLETA